MRSTRTHMHTRTHAHAQTDGEITGMLIAVLFAGQHTSSITSSWTGYLLMQHPVRGIECAPVCAVRAYACVCGRATC